MDLKYVITATNDNPKYEPFIPIFCKVWLKYGYTPIILYIGDKLPTQYSEYSQYITLYPPIPSIHTAFIAQCVRLLYPATLNYPPNIALTLADIEQYPVNPHFYTQSAKLLTTPNTLIVGDYLHQFLIGGGVMANTQTWRKLTNIKTNQDIIKRLTNWYKNINYTGSRGEASNPGWCTDQKCLTRMIYRNRHRIRIIYRPNAIVPPSIKRECYIRDKETNSLVIDPTFLKLIRNRKISFCQFPKTYKAHKDFIEHIITLLNPN